MTLQRGDGGPWQQHLGVAFCWHLSGASSLHTLQMSASSTARQHSTDGVAVCTPSAGPSPLLHRQQENGEGGEQHQAAQRVHCAPGAQPPQPVCRRKSGRAEIKWLVMRTTELHGWSNLQCQRPCLACCVACNLHTSTVMQLEADWISMARLPMLGKPSQQRWPWTCSHSKHPGAPCRLHTNTSGPVASRMRLHMCTQEKSTAQCVATYTPTGSAATWAHDRVPGSRCCRRRSGQMGGRMDRETGQRHVGSGSQRGHAKQPAAPPASM